MIGERIRIARETRGLSLREVAERSRISPGALSMIERGKRPNPSAHTLQALARVLNVRFVIGSRGVGLEKAR